MEKIFHLVGNGQTPEGFNLKVFYRQSERGTEMPRITVIWGEGRHAEETSLSARDILVFEYGRASWKNVGGDSKFLKYVKDPPGWFERRCREAQCEWFVPMVKRMAAGEQVSIEEIQTEYFAHNKKPMPCGKWSELFR